MSQSCATSAGSTAAAIDVMLLGAPEAELDEPPEPVLLPSPKLQLRLASPMDVSQYATVRGEMPCVGLTKKFADGTVTPSYQLWVAEL